jgi:preprotein translocase subunit SecG
MSTILLIIHSIIVIMIIGLVLLQRSEGGVLGMGGGGGGLSGLMTGRSQRNALTRATAILAGLFFVTSLGLSIIAGWEQKQLDNQISAAVESLPTPMPSQQPPLDAEPPQSPEKTSQSEKSNSGSTLPLPDSPSSKAPPSSGKPASLPPLKTP